MRTNRSPQSGSMLLAITMVCLGAVGSLGAAPLLPVPVPYENFDDEPYRWVGVVRTDSLGADPTVLGTGWVADQHVVVSAAHVFFVEENLGWNRNRWYFRRVARPEDFWKVEEAQRPRAYRALAGYATAVGRERESPSAFYDALNRDTIALLFYQSVYAGAPAPRLVNGLAGSATFNIAGYPTRLAGQPTGELARMYAHVGGHGGTFARWDERETDVLGHPFELFQTSDLQSGPGNSGGPVFRLENGVWKVAGVLLAGATDYSSVLARNIDVDADALITQAIADAIDPDLGQLVWRKEILNFGRPLCRVDGSIVYTASGASGDYVEAIDSAGNLLWRTDLGRLTNHGLSERPDGTIVVGDLGVKFVLDGGTGKVLFSIAVGGRDEMAIGAIGEFYMTNPDAGTVRRISPRGQQEWSITLPVLSPNPRSGMGPIVGADGTLYVATGGRVYALAPEDGAIRWMSALFDRPVGWTLAPAAGGGVFLLADGNAVMLEPDGSPRWSTAVPGSGLSSPVLGGDGRIYVPSGTTETIHVLGPDGAKQREVPFPLNVATSFTVDDAGTVYVGKPDRVEAFNAAGDLLWVYDEGGGQVSFAAGNRLVVVGGNGSSLSLLTTNAGRDDATWEQLIGGSDHARRAAHGAPVAPYFVKTPEAKRVVEGYRLELEADADGSYPLTFEWRRDGELLPDQVGRRLRIAKATPADSGHYTVTVRNLSGTISSTPVMITVAKPQFGDQLWTTNLIVKSAPAIAEDGTVYAAVAVERPIDSRLEHFLICLDPAGEELWRFDLGIVESSSTVVGISSIVIGEDRQVFVGARRTIWVIAPNGALLWKRLLTSNAGGDTPELALGPGRTIYVRLAGGLRLFDYEGDLGWQIDESFSGSARMLVRRNGSVFVGDTRVIITPDGSSVISPPHGGQLIGPNDELVGTMGESPRLTLNAWDAAGEHIWTTPLTSSAGQVISPVVMLENLEVVCSSSDLVPFLGSGSRTIDSGPVLILAALEGNRVLVRSNTRLACFQNTGEEVASFPFNFLDKWYHLAQWGSQTVGPQGQFVTGPRLSAFHVVWSLADSPWPSPRADSRNSSRAPGTYALTRDLVFRVDVSGPVKSFQGYTTAMQAHVLGASGSMQWKKDGQPLPGATNPELVFTQTQASDAGSYVFEVTTPAGVFASTPYELVVHQPEAAPDDLYVGQWPDNGSYTPYAMTVGSDGQFQLIIAGPNGRTARGQLNADGTFAIPGSPSITGHVQNQQLTFTSGPEGDVLPMFAPATGVAPNGMPAGVYRGRSRGPNSWPGNAIVFADGTIALTPAWPNGQAESVVTAFVGASRKIVFPDDPELSLSEKIPVEADPEGVLHGNAGSIDPAQPEFHLFWSGRPRTERLINLSTRGYVSPSTPPMIAGFVIKGDTPHALLLRGAGPGLALHGVQQPLNWARVRLMDPSAVELRRNEGWSAGAGATIVRESALRLGAFPFANNSKDAALHAMLDPGLYTMFIESADGSSGIALAEAYEDAVISGRNSRLTNLSTRGTLGFGERSLIGGFVIEGSRPKSLLIRVVGPSLRPFIESGVPVAPNPRVEIVAQNTNQIMAFNDDWGLALTPDIAEVSARVHAFPLPPDSLDAVALVSLPPGIYTAVGTSQSASEGIALLEIYEVDE